MWDRKHRYQIQGNIPNRHLIHLEPGQYTWLPHTQYLRTEQCTPTPHSWEDGQGSYCQQEINRTKYTAQINHIAVLLLHLYHRTQSASEFLENLYQVGFLTSFTDMMSTWLYIFNLHETPSEGLQHKTGRNCVLTLYGNLSLTII